MESVLPGLLPSGDRDVVRENQVVHWDFLQGVVVVFSSVTQGEVGKETVGSPSPVYTQFPDGHRSSGTRKVGGWYGSKGEVLYPWSL